MRNFEFFPFVVDKHNNVWKYVKAKDHFIKVTPWEPGEDRRVNRFEIEKLIIKNELTQMKNKPAVHEIINSRWDNIYYEWEYMGVKYTVEDCKHSLPIGRAPIHSFERKYKDASGKEHTWIEKGWRIGFNNGKIVWVNYYHYSPRIIMSPFESIDKEPHDNFSWTTDKHVRPIYSHKTGNLI